MKKSDAVTNYLFNCNLAIIIQMVEIDRFSGILNNIKTEKQSGQLDRSIIIN